MVFIALHPVFLLFSTALDFRGVDIIFPVWSRIQPLENTVGAIRLYLVLIVVITSYFHAKRFDC